jgi:hypothetical protein
MMDSETLAALDGSIRKWEAIVAGTGIDDGCDNCPLCKVFYYFSHHKGRTYCDGCPIYLDTGITGCERTPYDAWCEEWGLNTILGHNGEINIFAQELAQDMLDYLRSLRPTEQEAPE